MLRKVNLEPTEEMIDDFLVDYYGCDVTRRENGDRNAPNYVVEMIRWYLRTGEDYGVEPERG